MSTEIIVALISLADTDYLSLKYNEGDLTDKECEPIKLQRKALRDEIND